MKNFKDEWDILFIENLRKIGTLINEKFTFTEKYEVFIVDEKIISGSRTIINDILLFFSNPGLYWMCMNSPSKIPYDILVGQMWLLIRKYWIRWSWCHWRWKFSCTIKIWYNQWLEVTNKRARFILIHWISQFLSHICYILQNTHEAIKKISKIIYRKPIPLMIWTPSLIELFNKLKKRSDILTSISKIWSW